MVSQMTNYLITEDSRWIWDSICFVRTQPRSRYENVKAHNSFDQDAVADHGLLCRKITSSCVPRAVYSRLWHRTGSAKARSLPFSASSDIAIVPSFFVKLGVDFVPQENFHALNLSISRTSPTQTLRCDTHGHPSFWP